MAHRRLEATELGLYFSVGSKVQSDEEVLSDRAKKAYDAFDALLKEEGMSLLGRPDPTISDDFRYLPFELFEFGWDCSEDDGLVIYPVWVNAPNFTRAEAGLLRDMGLRAFQSVCGADARFIRAEVTQEWKELVTTAYDFDEASSQTKG